MKRSIRIIMIITLITAFIATSLGLTSIAVESLKLGTTNVTISVGSTYKLKVTIAPENATNKKVTFLSKNRKIASVDKDGNIKGIVPGKTVITVTSSANKKAVARCNVTILKFDTSPITLELFQNIVDNPVGAYTPGWGKNPVSKRIIKDTGVNLDFTYSPDGTDQRLNLLIATNELPDIIAFAKPAQIQELISKGLVVDFNEFSKTAAPNFMSMIPKKVLANTRYMTDTMGLYVLPINFSTDEQVLKFELPRNMVGFSVVYEAYKKAGSPKVESADDLYNLLKRIKQDYPDMIIHSNRGTILADSLGFPGIVSTLAPYAGITTYSITDGKVKMMYEDPDIIKVIKLANRLYNDKIVFQDEFVADSPRFANLSNGKVIAEFTEDFDNLVFFSDKLAASDNGKKYDFTHFIMLDGPKLIPGKSPVFGANKWAGSGNSGYMVKKGKNAARAVRLLEYLILNEKSQIMGVYGIEGLHYDMVNDVPVIRQKYLDSYKADSLKTRTEEGIHYLANSFKCGPWQQLFFRQVYGEPEFVTAAKKITNKNSKDLSEFNGIGNFDKDSEEAKTMANIRDYVSGEITKIITGNLSDVDTKYANMLKQIRNMGLDKVNSGLSENYKKRAAKMVEYSK